MTDEVGGTLVHLDRASGETDRNDARRAAGGRDPRRRLALDRRAGRRRRPPRRHPEDGSEAVHRLHRSGARLHALRRGSSSPWCSTGSSASSASAAPTGTRSCPTSRARFPTPTDNGKTYTFRLREGIKFADGRELKASAVRYSLERLFKVAVAAVPDFYEGIVGGAACRKQPERCDLSQGRRDRRRHGDRHDQAARARPRLSPQAGAAVRVHRPDRHTRHRREADTRHRPVPDRGVHARTGASDSSAIPTSRCGRRRLSRKASRTRSCSSWAAQPRRAADGGAARTGRRHSKAFRRTGSRRLRTRYAAQLHVTPEPGTFFLVLNTKRPPFDDVRARRAVAYAVDRGRLVDGFGGNDVAAPTCQLLPPNFPGLPPVLPVHRAPDRRRRLDGPGSRTRPQARRGVRHEGDASRRRSASPGRVGFSGADDEFSTRRCNSSATAHR